MSPNWAPAFAGEVIRAASLGQPRGSPDMPSPNPSRFAGGGFLAPDPVSRDLAVGVIGAEAVLVDLA